MTGLTAASTVGLCVATVVAMLTARHDVPADEAWMLVVAERVQDRHDALYRDVFFGVGPLPVWLLTAVTRRSGIEVRALRLLDALATGVVGGALWHVGSAVGLPWWGRLVPVALTTLASGPVADLASWYANLSRAGVAIALVAAFDGGAWAVAVAGAALGVALLSKYTIGIAVAPFALAVAWVSTDDRRLLLVGVAAASVIAAASIAPLLRQPGAFRWMLIRLGPGKRSFLAHGRLGLWSLVRHRTQDVVLLSAVVPLVTAAIPAVLDARRRGAPTSAVWLVLGLSAAFVACTWPRADRPHLRAGLPFGVAAALVAASEWRSSHPGIWFGVLGGVIAAWALVLCVVGLRDSIRRGTFRPGRTVRGCRGAGCRFDDEQVRDLWIASELAGGVAMILGTDAPLAYLVSGIHDPTPFDYPLASTFGVNGQQVVADAIRAGTIAWVVEVDPMPASMSPALVDEAVHECLEVVWQHDGVRLLGRGGDQR